MDTYYRYQYGTYQKGVANTIARANQQQKTFRYVRSNEELIVRNGLPYLQ